MAKENNATCSICGSEYHVCLSCKDKMKLHPYKIYCCSPSHFQVFQVVRGFSTGVYDKDEAKEKFKNIDLTDIESFRPHIRNIIKDIIKEDKVVVETTEKIESTVVEDIEEVKVEETNVEEVEISNIVEDIVEDIVKPTVSRKRNYKMEAE